MTFNVLTDAWIPLDDGAGQVKHASYGDLLTGALDAADLVHPRDDVRFFSRMLLSALTQALFGDVVPTAGDLKKQIAEPLSPDIVKERIDRVKADFELIGAGAFLQGPAREKPRKKAAGDREREEEADDAVDSLLYDVAKHQLARGGTDPGVVGPAAAVPLLYAAQAFCRQGGSGYFSGVRGAPPVTTLVKLGTVRESAWANVLHGQSREGYGRDSDKPWLQRASNAEGSIGLVEGLFWQPLGAELSWAEATVTCSASGAAARGVRVQRLGGRMRAGSTWYSHPYSPVVEGGAKGSRIKFLHLRSDRPAWTGLGDLLPGLDEDGKRRSTRPAPVVEQWAELEMPESSLVVLDYLTKQANVTGRFVEVFPLREALRDDRLADFAAKRVEETDVALNALRQGLFPLSPKAKHGEVFLGRAAGRKNASDVTASFWQRTEPLFWAAFDAKVAGTQEPAAFRLGVERAALDLFDEATSTLDGDPAGLARVVVQRCRLRQQLRKALHLPTPAERAAEKRGSVEGGGTMPNVKTTRIPPGEAGT